MNKESHGYYVYSINQQHKQDFEKSGIGKKIQNQISTLQDAGIDCTLKLVLNPETIGSKIMQSIPLIDNHSIWNPDDVKNADFIYIRKVPLKSGFMNYLRDVRMNNPKALILLEIPTYPYDGEARTFSERLSLLLDKSYRKSLGKYVDYIVDLFGYDRIFGVPTIHISNGVPVTESSKKNPSGDTKELRMVCAASFSFWHGIDRLINGMSEYRNRGESRPMHLMLIGKGTDQLREQVTHLGLEDEVSFVGPTQSDKLNRYYDMCNMGVESLARFRTHNTTLNSSLKSRDYLNSGLPFFGEGMVDVFSNQNFPYYYQVPSDNTPIDMGQIFQFFDEIYGRQTEEEVIRQIHKFASETVDMQTTFANVICKIKDHN